MENDKVVGATRSSVVQRPVVVSTRGFGNNPIQVRPRASCDLRSAAPQHHAIASPGQGSLGQSAEGARKATKLGAGAVHSRGASLSHCLTLQPPQPGVPRVPGWACTYRERPHSSQGQFNWGPPTRLRARAALSKSPRTPRPSQEAEELRDTAATCFQTCRVLPSPASSPLNILLNAHSMFSAVPSS